MAFTEVDERDYVLRSVDTEVWKDVDAWFQGDAPARWIAIASEAGRGNTSFLARLASLATYHWQSNSGLLCVHGETGRPEYRDGDVTPLAEALSSARSAKRARWWHSIAGSLRNTPAPRLCITAFLLLLLPVAGTMAPAWSDYRTEMKGTNVAGAQNTKRFIVTYLPAHRDRIPIWLFTYFIQIPLYGGLALLVKGVLPRPAPSRVTPEAQAEFRKPGHCLASFRATFGAERNVLILVDDADALPSTDRQLLIELFQHWFDAGGADGHRGMDGSARSTSELAPRRICIVTIDKGGSKSRWSGHGWRDAFDGRPTIDDFTEAELAYIASHYRQGSSLSREEILDQAARANGRVTSLLAPWDTKTGDEVAGWFLEKHGSRSHDAFDHATMVAWVVASGRPFFAAANLDAALRSAVQLNAFAVVGWQPPPRRTTVSGALKEVRAAVVHLDGMTVLVDPRRGPVLTSWLSRNDPDLLRKCHLLWALIETDALIPGLPDAQTVSGLAVTAPTRVRQAAWQLSRAAFLRGTGSVGTGSGSAALVQDDTAWRHRFSALLAASAQACALWGETGRSRHAASLALAWADGEAVGADRALEQLWSLYWVSADTETRSELDAACARWPHLTQSTVWCVNARHEQVLKSEAEISPASSDPSGLSDAVERLTDSFLRVRDMYGFEFKALKDPAVQIEDPVASDAYPYAEMQLRALRCGAQIARNDLEAARQAQVQWAERLNAIPADGGDIGSDTLRWYAAGRTWHLLHDLVRARNMPPGSPGSPEVQDVAQASADSPDPALVSACAVATVSVDLIAALRGKVEESYRRCAALAALISWVPLAGEAAFRQGQFEYENPTDPDDRDDQTWWREWDDHYDECLDMEYKTGWIVHGPACHAMRCRFFQDQDTDLSEDGYNTYTSVRDANYPRAVLLKWHQEAQRILTQARTTVESAVRSAELYESWARVYLDWKEAESYRKWRVLDMDRASALMFASQSCRLAGRLDDARALLDEAAALQRGSRSAELRVGTRPRAVRDFRMMLMLQEAWLLEDLGSAYASDYERSIRRLWRVMVPSDRASAQVLACLVAVEAEQGKLARPPGTSADHGPGWDAGSKGMSVPSTWFSGDRSVTVATVRDLRVCQLGLILGPASMVERGALRFVFNEDGGIKEVTAGEADHASEVAAMRAKPPTRDELLEAAERGWEGLSKGGESTLHVARTAGQFADSSSVRLLLVAALQSARLYFERFEPKTRAEMKCLTELKRLDKGNEWYRDRYEEVLRENGPLEVHELSVVLRSPNPSLANVAERVSDLLEVLVDEDLRARRVAEALKRDGITGQQCMDKLDRQRAAVGLAKSSYSAGHPWDAFVLLEPNLPDIEASWVFMEDLLVLDLCVRCARDEPRIPADRAATLSAQLRDMAVRFVEQYADVVVGEPHVHQFAVRLLQSLEDYRSQGSAEPTRESTRTRTARERRRTEWAERMAQQAMEDTGLGPHAPTR